MVKVRDGQLPEADWSLDAPGQWMLDESHMPPGCTPLMQQITLGSLPAGMRRIFRDLGTPADTLDLRFVNGRMYTRLRPLIGADKPPRRLPPKVVLKVASRVHPEMRRRNRTAARVLVEKPWNRVIDEWENGGRALIEQRNLALQDIAVAELDDAMLIEHVHTLIAHCTRNFEHHFWLHGYDLGPIGRFLTVAVDAGLAVSDVVPLLEGASPSTSAPGLALRAIRDDVEDTGSTPATLAELRAVSAKVSAQLDNYLRYRGALLFSRYDLDGITLGEVPDIVLATVLNSAPRDTGDAVRLRIADVRSRVAQHDLALFDEALAEARAAMNLRDDNGPTTAEWPLGLVRLALLEVGRRMVDKGAAAHRNHVFELHGPELTVGQMQGSGVPADELAGRATARRAQTLLKAPGTIGAPEVAPPLDVLPGPLANTVRMVMMVIEQLGMDGRASGSGLAGTGVGSVVYRGTARRADTPEAALDSLQPGDVLVVPCTTPAYNVVLALAGAVVTATGGPLSHAAVLARELGIPAVVGARGALTDIPDGALVEVDPLAGEVRVLSLAE